MIDWLSDNKEFTALIVAVLPVLWGIIQYVLIARETRRQQRFKNYHQLIKELVEPTEGKDSLYLDRQLAVAFELGFYSEYREPTLRILKGLKSSWSQKPGAHSRLVEQMDATIQKLERKSCIR